jgi:hypothetical protein
MRLTRILVECIYRPIKQAKRGSIDPLRQEYKEQVNQIYEKETVILHDDFRRMIGGGRVQRIRELGWTGSSKGMNFDIDLRYNLPIDHPR